MWVWIENQEQMRELIKTSVIGRCLLNHDVEDWSFYYDAIDEGLGDMCQCEVCWTDLDDVVDEIVRTWEVKKDETD